MLETLETDIGDAVNEPINACVVSTLNGKSETPHFVKRPVDTYVVAHRSAMIEARVAGTPSPEIKWFKNWNHIKEGPRIKV